MSGARSRRTSLFSQKIGNIAFRDKLKEEIQSYVQVLSENTSNASELESPKHLGVTLLSNNKTEFLESLPSIEEYNHLMIEFLHNYSNVQSELEGLQRKIETKALQLL